MTKRLYLDTELVENLEKELKEAELKFHELRHKLDNEKRKIPEGYRRLKHGEVVSKDSISFEPCHGVWDNQPGNCIGKKINDEGYVTGIVHRGWIFAGKK